MRHNAAEEKTLLSMEIDACAIATLVRRQQHVLVHRKVNPEWAPASGNGDPAIFMPQLRRVLTRYRMDHLPDSEMLTFITSDVM